MLSPPPGDELHYLPPGRLSLSLSNSLSPIAGQLRDRLSGEERRRLGAVQNQSVVSASGAGK